MAKVSEKKRAQNREYMRKYLAKNRDAINAKRRARYHANNSAERKKKERLRAREMYYANPEKFRERSRQNRIKNPEYLKEMNQKHYAENKDRRLSYERHKTLADARAKKPRSGTLYLFQARNSNWIKLGQTINWAQRKQGYTGPNRPGRIFFRRPVKNLDYAEMMLKCFFKAAHKNVKFEPREEWFRLPSRKPNLNA